MSIFIFVRILQQDILKIGRNIFCLGAVKEVNGCIHELTHNDVGFLSFVSLLFDKSDKDSLENVTSDSSNNSETKLRKPTSL